MRKFPFPSPMFNYVTDPRWRWVVEAIRGISNASNDQITEEIADAYTPSNVTTTRTFDADATTVAELADVVGTLIEDMKNRGVKGG